MRAAYHYDVSKGQELLNRAKNISRPEYINQSSASNLNYQSQYQELNNTAAKSTMSKKVQFHEETEQKDRFVRKYEPPFDNPTSTYGAAKTRSTFNYEDNSQRPRDTSKENTLTEGRSQYSEQGWRSSFAKSYRP